MIKMKSLRSFIDESVLDKDAGVPDYDIKPAQKLFSDILMWSKKHRPNGYWIALDTEKKSGKKLFRHGPEAGTCIYDKKAQQGFVKSMQALAGEPITNFKEAETAQQEMFNDQCAVVSVHKYDGCKFGIVIDTNDAHIVLFDYHHKDFNPSRFKGITHVFPSMTDKPVYKINKFIGDELIKLIIADRSW